MNTGGGPHQRALFILRSRCFKTGVKKRTQGGCRAYFGKRTEVKNEQIITKTCKKRYRKKNIWGVYTPSDGKALHTITYGNKIYNYFDFIDETA